MGDPPRSDSLPSFNPRECPSAKPLVLIIWSCRESVMHAQVKMMLLLMQEDLAARTMTGVGTVPGSVSRVICIRLLSTQGRVLAMHDAQIEASFNFRYEDDTVSGMSTVRQT